MLLHLYLKTAFKNFLREQKTNSEFKAKAIAHFYTKLIYMLQVKKVFDGIQA